MNSEKVSAPNTSINNGKRDKTIYWIVTGLFAAFMIMNVVVYLLMNEMVSDMFASLGYPTYIVYPLAVAKLLGIVAILTKQSELLKEWAYAGFFFDFVLAFAAHFMVGDGGVFGPLAAMVLLLVSRIYDWKVFGPTYQS